MKKEKVKKEKKEKTPMTPEIKKTWMTSLTAFICVIAVSATANSVIGKVCDTKVEAAKSSGSIAVFENAGASEDGNGFTADTDTGVASENVSADTSNDGSSSVIDASSINGGGSVSSNLSNSSSNKTENKTSSTTKTTAEVVNIYNTAANKIKSNAKSITRNYSKMQSLPEYLQLPSAISSLGKWAIEKFVKGSNEPATFTSKDEIMAYFPISGESYTSHLTSDMVKSTSFKDAGKTYEITFVLYNDKLTSPKKGTGYAGVFNTVSASTFEEINVPGTKFESVKINGINGKIQCTIDKATGHVTKAIYTNTDVLNLGVKVAGSNLNVKFALACENSYSIKY